MPSDDRVLTDGDVEAIAEATATRLAEIVSAAPGTFALLDARQLARDLGVSLDYVVRARHRAGSDAARLRGQGTHSLRSRSGTAGARGPDYKAEPEKPAMTRPHPTACRFVPKPLKAAPRPIADGEGANDGDGYQRNDPHRARSFDDATEELCDDEWSHEVPGRG